MRKVSEEHKARAKRWGMGPQDTGELGSGLIEVAQDGPVCKLCGTREKKDPAGHSNISYATNICIDCLMNWR
jgi:hypothetical protein